MKILIVTDKGGTAIDRLAQSVVRNLPLPNPESPASFRFAPDIETEAEPIVISPEDVMPNVPVLFIEVLAV